MDPLVVYSQEKDRVRISIFIIDALEFCDVNLVELLSVSKYRSRLRMDATHDDSLRHAL
jgi:hypothetical protein